MGQGEVNALNLKTGGNLYSGNLVNWGMVNTGKLYMNDKQECKHKAHLRQSYSKCLTVWHDDA